MGVLFTYFLCSDSETAGSVIDLPGGPMDKFPSITNGIEPVVQMGVFESILTGVDFDEVMAAGLALPPVAIRDEGERLVLAATQGLQNALASSTEEQFTDAVDIWAESEEFFGMADPEDLLSIVNELSELCKGAQPDERLYCFVSV